MARATIKNLNAFIRREFPGLEIEFVKGAGYFYFAGVDGFALQVESIFVCHLSHGDREFWERQISASIKDAQFLNEII